MNTGNLISFGGGIAVAELCVRERRPGCGGQGIKDEHRGPIVVIDRCEPARSYLVRCLEEATDGAHVIAFASATQWLQVAGDGPRPRVVLLCNPGREDPGSETEDDLLLLANLANVPVIVVPSIEATTTEGKLLSQFASSGGPTPCEALNSVQRGEQWAGAS